MEMISLDTVTNVNRIAERLAKSSARTSRNPLTFDAQGYHVNGKSFTEQDLDTALSMSGQEQQAALKALTGKTDETNGTGRALKTQVIALDVLRSALHKDGKLKGIFRMSADSAGLRVTCFDKDGKTVAVYSVGRKKAGFPVAKIA